MKEPVCLLLGRQAKTATKVHLFSHPPDDVFLKLVFMSRRVFDSSVIFMLSAVLLFISTNSWLEFLVGRLFLVGAILMLLRWMVPGIFIFFGKPSFTLAWLQGLTPNGRAAKSWDKLSVGEKVSIYSYSMIIFFVAVSVVVVTILNMQK